MALDPSSITPFVRAFVVLQRVYSSFSAIEAK